MVGLAEDPESRMHPHTIRMLDLGESVHIYNVHLPEDRLTTTVSGEAGTWCWHANMTAKSVKKLLPSLQQHIPFREKASMCFEWGGVFRKHQ